jgi:hypothetical protein
MPGVRLKIGALMRHLKLLKSRVGLLVCVAVVAGCASSTIQSRRQERAAFFGTLPPQVQSYVMQGRIAVGMTADAVYIALGNPNQVLESQDSSGASTTWLYHSTWMQEETYWNSHEYQNGNHPYREHFADRDYIPQEYVSLEVTFVNGRVAAWRNLPRPM